MNLQLFSFFMLSNLCQLAVTNDSLNNDICPPVLDIIILFDTSGGNDTVFEQQKNWTIQIARDLPIHQDAVRVGLIQYSDNAKTEFNLSRYSERNYIIDHLEKLTFASGEDTRTGVALNRANEEMFNFTGGARLKANRLIIVFTDGLSMDKPVKAAKVLRRKGVKIYTISVNSIGFVPEMLGIVGDADNVFGPNDEYRIEERLLNEVERSRSCDVQPKRYEKTTSSYGRKATQSEASTLDAEMNSKSILHETSTTPIITASKFSTLTAEATHRSSEETDLDNSVKDIVGTVQISNETETTTDSITTRETTLFWREPVQLFTVEPESTQLNKIQNLTNLKTVLADDANTSEAGEKAETSESIEEKLDAALSKTLEEIAPITKQSITPLSDIETTSHISESTTVATLSPIVTTICINPSTTAVPTFTTSVLPRHSTKLFFEKLGVIKSKENNDPGTTFLGRDVSNSDLFKEDEEDKETEFKTSSFEKSIGNESDLKNKSSSDSSDLSKIVPSTTAMPATTRFSFSTKVTNHPFTTTARTTISTPTTAFRASTRTAPNATSPVTTPSKSTTVTSIQTTTTKPILSTFRDIDEESLKFSAFSNQLSNIPQKPLSLKQTLSTVTAFPTLLSMEKSVTLPMNRALNVSKTPKRKIRRIIKRRRNTLPSSQAQNVTDTLPEVTRKPTPTVSPIRSTLKPIVIEEEKENDAFNSGVQCPMDILFVVDSSGSIANTYDIQKDYLTQLIKKVEPSRSHRVGLIQFSGPHIQKMEWSFDTHSKNSQLLSAIRSVRHLTGTTYIGAALELSLILLESRRKHTETAIILISDGFSQDDSTQQAKLLRQLLNVKMYAISLNKLTNTKYLTDIVGDRKNLFVNDESKLFEEFFTKKLKCDSTTR